MLQLSNSNLPFSLPLDHIHSKLLEMVSTGVEPLTLIIHEELEDHSAINWFPVGVGGGHLASYNAVLVTNVFGT